MHVYDKASMGNTPQRNSGQREMYFRQAEATGGLQFVLIKLGPSFCSYMLTQDFRGLISKDNLKTKWILAKSGTSYTFLLPVPQAFFAFCSDLLLKSGEVK